MRHLIHVGSGPSCERQIQIFYNQYSIETFISYLGDTFSNIQCANHILSEILKRECNASICTSSIIYSGVPRRKNVRTFKSSQIHLDNTCNFEVSYEYFGGKLFVFLVKICRYFILNCKQNCLKHSQKEAFPESSYLIKGNFATPEAS